MSQSEFPRDLNSQNIDIAQPQMGGVEAEILSLSKDYKKIKEINTALEKISDNPNLTLEKTTGNILVSYRDHSFGYYDLRRGVVKMFFKDKGPVVFEDMSLAQKKYL